MYVLDTDKERIKEIEERFEEITPTNQKSQKEKKTNKETVTAWIKDKDNVRETLRYKQLKHQRNK